MRHGTRFPFCRTRMRNARGPRIRAARDRFAVDLALVLAVDASGSVDQARFELQKQGYVAAFRHPRVIARDPVRPDAVDRRHHDAMDRTGAAGHRPCPGRAFPTRHPPMRSPMRSRPRRARCSAAARRSPARSTPRWALLFDNPYRAARRVIDVSGDGANNRGRPAAPRATKRSRTASASTDCRSSRSSPTSTATIEQNVIGGPGAFVIAAKDFETFGEAILKKLIAEIANAPPEPASAQHASASAH